MARTALTPARVSITGLDVKTATNGTAGDTSNGNVVAGNDGTTLVVIVANTSGDTAYDVTFVTTATVGNRGYAVGDEVIELAAGAVKAFGPFPLAEFGTSLQINVENAALKLQALYL